MYLKNILYREEHGTGCVGKIHGLNSEETKRTIYNRFCSGRAVYVMNNKIKINIYVEIKE